jgi:hypothetical protein
LQFKSLSKNILQKHFQKKILANGWCHTSCHSTTCIIGRKKPINFVTSTTIVVVVLLFSFEFYKNIGQILVGCHRRWLFTINWKCTPPLLIKLIPPPWQQHKNNKSTKKCTIIMNQRPHILMTGNPILKIFQKLRCEIIEKYLRFKKGELLTKI